MITSYSPCLSETGIHRIIHGMTSESMEESKFKLGGCCLSDLNPKSNCVQCVRKGDYATVKLIWISSKEYPVVNDFTFQGLAETLKSL